jgi:hypothetical protein
MLAVAVASNSILELSAHSRHTLARSTLWPDADDADIIFNLDLGFHHTRLTASEFGHAHVNPSATVARLRSLSDGIPLFAATDGRQ